MHQSLIPQPPVNLRLSHFPEESISLTTQTRPIPRDEGLRAWQHCVLFLAAALILISRRPDGMLHAQFYAEDGSVWFADAYNYGWWPALFRTWAGYYQTLPRLVASLGLPVSFQFAPLLLNLIDFAIEALPVTLLLSNRSRVWGSLRFRTCMAGVYLALPGCAGVRSGVTESQWQMALCAFLILVATTPKNVAARAASISILLLCGLSGPFCIFLLPMALYLAWKYSDRWRWITSGVLALLCVAQAWAMFVVSPSNRPQLFLGANAGSFAKLLASQIYLGVLLGPNGLGFQPGPKISAALFITALGGTALVAICFFKSTLEMRLLLLYSFLIFGASIVSPAIHVQPGIPTWQLLAGAGGIHYWFFPTLAFAWTLLWCLHCKSQLLKVISGYLLFFLCIASIRDWKDSTFKDLHFSDYANQMQTAPKGAVVTIPENPEGWEIRLVKH